MQTTPNPVLYMICLECQVQVSLDDFENEHNGHKGFISTNNLVKIKQAQIDENFKRLKDFNEEGKESQELTKYVR